MATDTATTTTATAVADPGPLGLFSFAIAVFVIGAANAKFTGVDPSAALTLALALGLLGLVPAGLIAFKNGDTFSGTTFISYGAFLVSFWAFFTIGADKPATSTDIAWYLLAWTIFTGILLIGTLRLAWGFVLVFALLFLTLLLTIGYFNPPANPADASPLAGYVALATGVVAYYLAAAGILRAASGGRINLPIFPISG